MNKRIAYVRDRTVNAFWMLREGKFQLIFRSIWVELNHRIEAFNTWRRTRREIPESKVPWSRFQNKQKVIPPSYRPTVSAPMPGEPLRADRDEVVAELKRSLVTVRLPSVVDE